MGAKGRGGGGGRGPHDARADVSQFDRTACRRAERHTASDRPLFIFGGGDKADLLNELHVFNATPSRGRCRRRPGCCRRARAHELVVGSMLYIWGGIGGGMDVHVLDTKSMHWSTPAVHGDVPEVASATRGRWSTAARCRARCRWAATTRGRRFGRPRARHRDATWEKAARRRRVATATPSPGRPARGAAAGVPPRLRRRHGRHVRHAVRAPLPEAGPSGGPRSRRAARPPRARAPPRDARRAGGGALRRGGGKPLNTVQCSTLAR